MNIILTNGKQKIDKSKVFKYAWILKNELNISFNLALKISYKKHKSLLYTSFWTNATIEDIEWTMHRCVKDGMVRTDILMKWDKDKRKHPLDWVSYHLRRNGFVIDNIKQDIIKDYEIITL